MSNQHDHHHESPVGDDPTGSPGATFGWMLVPLVPTLFFTAYFILSGKFG